MNELFPYIKDGITIRPLNTGGYEVFTISTQHFNITSLEELTSDRFDLAIHNFNASEQIAREAFGQLDTQLNDELDAFILKHATEYEIL